MTAASAQVTYCPHLLLFAKFAPHIARYLARSLTLVLVPSTPWGKKLANFANDDKFARLVTQPGLKQRRQIFQIILQ